MAIKQGFERLWKLVCILYFIGAVWITIMAILTQASFLDGLGIFLILFIAIPVALFILRGIFMWVYEGFKEKSKPD